MISASKKLKGVAVVLFLLCGLAFAAGATFSVTATDDTQQLPDLKQRAVLEFLQRYLGERYDQYAPQVTADFAEGYILDYKVGKAGNRLQVIGHLDAERLKGWIRLAETKKGSTGVKPMLVISSTIPGLTISPSQTGARVREGALGQTLQAEAAAAFQKVNAKLGVPGGPGLSHPPRIDSELRALRDYGNSEGYSVALWAHLVPCRTCGGARLDLFLYNLSQARRVLAKSEDLPLSGGDFNSSPRLKTVLKAPFAAFRNDLEALVSSGQIFSAAYFLTVEGVENYRVYKLIESGLGELDYIIQSVMKFSSPKIAEFEILTTLPGQELLSRLDNESFSGFDLKPVRVDSHNLVMRYSKQ